MSLYDMKMAEESPEVASNLTSMDIKIKALDNQLTALKNRVDVLDNRLGYEKGENKAFRELNLHLVDRIKKLENNNKELAEGASNTALKLSSAEDKIRGLNWEINFINKRLLALEEANFTLKEKVDKLEIQNKLLIDALNILYSNYYYDYEKDFYRLYETDNSALKALNEFEEGE